RLLDRRNLLTHRRGDAQLVIGVDGVGDLTQVLVQLDLFLPSDAEARHRQGHRGENADDGDDGDQFGKRESTTASHSTLAWPPVTSEATRSPRPFLRPGSSITR